MHFSTTIEIVVIVSQKSQYGRVRDNIFGIQRNLSANDPVSPIMIYLSEEFCLFTLNGFALQWQRALELAERKH